MRAYFSILPLLYVFQLSSCSDEKTTEKKDVEKNYFSDAEVPDSAIDFKNEMATGETDFLRSLSTHQIAWQKWNHEILKKAKDAQRPIFALLCSPLGSASRTVVNELNENQDLRGIISSQAICTVIDSTVNPEMANLGYRLSAEEKKSAAFPMIIWLSHEGSPIASDPVGNISGRELKVVVSNLANVVEDLWTKSSRYTVENSRSENEKRQLRLEPNVEELKQPITRNELFQRETRQLSSLYSFGDKNLDFIGGLIPSSSIELLAIGSRSANLTGEVREQSREAAKVMTLELTSGALKDHLTGSYFYARRTDDWTLPFFSTDLLSQAKVAVTLMKVGNLLGDERFTKQGLELLELLETEWLAKEISSKCPNGNADIAGAFLWDYRTLKKILDPDQLKVATIAFSLEPTGNIPLETDPLGNYFNLNSLRGKTSTQEVADELQLSVEEASKAVKTIKSKLLTFRREQIKITRESTLTVKDLALVLRAQILRANHTGSPAHFDAAKAIANRILSDYWKPEKGLFRISSDSTMVPARCQDVMAVGRSLNELYQATLDQHWLKSATEIVDHNIQQFGYSGKILTEVTKEEQIIPLKQFSVSMIFGESTLGISDQTLSRLYALTGNEIYGGIVDAHRKYIARQAKGRVVYHTDYISSCSLGDSPLMAILQGDIASKLGKQFISILNAPKYLSFLTIRPESANPLLTPLTGLPPAKGTASVVLTRAGEALGQISTSEELTELLDSVISGE
ncbi:MAG: DUF255 domain-containing protein [Verrucomicrobia bacterium]|nr:DUF255 domain-containing protein [Verrucomicrobiota bacterium]